MAAPKTIKLENIENNKINFSIQDVAYHLFDSNYLDHLRDGRKSKVKYKDTQIFCLYQHEIPGSKKKINADRIKKLFDEFWNKFDLADTVMHLRNEFQDFFDERLIIVDKNGCVKREPEFVEVMSTVYDAMLFSEYRAVNLIDSLGARESNRSDCLDAGSVDALEVPAKHVDHVKLENEDPYYFLLINGDLFEDAQNFNDRLKNFDSSKNTKRKTHPFPTISFRCLSEMTKLTDGQVVSKLRDNSLWVIDYISDEVIKATKNQLEAADPKPPERGFSLIRITDVWHKPSSILIGHKKGKTVHHYIMGMDEDSYFASELPKPVSTVESAFEELKPHEIRHRNDIDRQGEWFVVPVSQSSVPHVSESYYADSVFLPKESDNASDHIVHCNNFDETATVKNQILINATNGQIYARSFVLEHASDDHAPIEKIEKNGWFTFMRNTAVRSVSVEGVD